MADTEQAIDNEVEDEPREVQARGAAHPPTPAKQTPTPPAGDGASQEPRVAHPPTPGKPGVDPDGDGVTEDADAGEVAGDLDELVATAAQRDEYLALAQRTQADFENYRKRVARESAQAQERGVAKLVKELLPALDSLDRALDGAAQDDPLLEGVRLVRSELMAALERVGIQAFAPLGEPFDPNTQEAVAQQPVEAAQSGTVAEVYQTGYRLHGNVIRPARVLVAA